VKPRRVQRGRLNLQDRKMQDWKMTDKNCRRCKMTDRLRGVQRHTRRRKMRHWNPRGGTKNKEVRWGDKVYLFVLRENKRIKPIKPPDSKASWRDFWGPKMLQNPNFPGLHPGPRWGSLQRPPLLSVLRASFLRVSGSNPLQSWQPY